MKFEFAEQYGIPCVVIEAGEDAEAIIEACGEAEAVLYNDPDGPEYCVQFPGRPQELYTAAALAGSLPIVE